MASLSSDEFARMLAQMRSAYLAELPQRLADTEALVLEADKTADFAELYETLYRNVHSMKGSAGTHGLHIISAVCHNLEDMLTEVSADQSKVNQDVINNWLGYLDLLDKARQRLENGEDNFADIEQTLDELRYTSPEVKYTALMIEPSAMYAQMCEQVFTAHGVNIAYASDGYEALGRLLSEPFDILITSMQIPRLGGLALVGALRMSSGRNSQIKSVILTTESGIDCKRDTDPDHVVEKNNKMLEQLEQVAKDIIKSLA
jgi:chemotaxis protein histidine kinase CheA